MPMDTVTTIFYNILICKLYIVSLANPFAATSGTNIRNAAFKNCSFRFIKYFTKVYQQWDNVNSLNSHTVYHTIKCPKVTIIYKDINKTLRQLAQLYCNWFCNYRKRKNFSVIPI